MFANNQRTELSQILFEYSKPSLILQLRHGRSKSAAHSSNLLLSVWSSHRRVLQWWVVAERGAVRCLVAQWL